MNPNDLNKNKGAENISKATPTIRQVGEDKIEIENLTFEGKADLNLEGSTKSIDTGNNSLDAANDGNITGNAGPEATFDDGEDLSSDSESTGLDMRDSDSGADDLGMDDVSDESPTSDTLGKDPSDEVLPEEEQSDDNAMGKPLGEDKEDEKKADDDKLPEKDEKKNGGGEADKPSPAEDGEKNPPDKNGPEKKDENDKKGNPEENSSDNKQPDQAATNNGKQNKPNDSNGDKKAPQDKKDADKSVNGQGANSQKNNSPSNNGQKRNAPSGTQNNKLNKNRGNKKAGNGGSLKDRARSRAKNAANNAYKNSSLGQTVGNVKDKVDKVKKTVEGTKKAVKTIKAGAMAIKGFMAAWPTLLFILIIIVICALLVAFTPGIKGNVNDDKDNYSEVDKKTLEQLNKLFNKYPNADGALAIVTVIYPYYDSLWGTNVGSMVKESSNPNNETEEEEDESDADDDKGDYESEDKVQDDIYLELFQKWRYRNRLKKILKELNNGDEEAFFQYLKNTYFSNYGYDDMLDKVNDKDALKDYIIEDLKVRKNDFINYVGKVYNCHVTTQSIGSVDVNEVIKSGNILIDVKEESCTTSGSDMVNCASWHDSPITLKEYVKGVTNTEISIDENTSLHKIKAQMIMVKSFVLGRYDEMGWDISQDSSGNYIIPIRANTYDQDYCDYNVGCSNKKSGNKHGPASDGVKALLDQAYDETVNEYIFDVNKGRTAAAYKTNYDKYCVKGSCLITPEFETGLNTGLTYDQILTSAFTDYAFVPIDPITGSGTAQVSGGKVCVEVGGGTGVPSDKFVYYAQTDPRWKDTQFCGRNDGTIGTSGCGVTSMAMVISTLSNKVVTPIDTMNEAHSIGYCGYGIVGTNYGYFLDVAHDYELENVSLSKDSKGADKALQTLRDGGLVIANVGPKSPFTTGGHYIVIRSIASDRNVYVGDPNHEELFNTSYSIDDFIDKGWVTNGWWGFTGPKSLEFSTMIGEKGVATGMFTNPFDPANTATTYTSSGNAESFPKYKSGSCHGGVDIPKNEGTSIYALDGGVVTAVGNYSSNCYQKSECGRGWNSYGIYVLINHKNGYQTIYAHLNSRTVDVGDKVAKGQQIGLTGNTGNSTGPHIHLELRDVEKYNANNRDEAKCTSGLGLMNVTKYINTGVSYVGGIE